MLNSAYSDQIYFFPAVYFRKDDAALQISVTSSVVAIMSSAASLLSFHHSGHGESVKMGCALKTMCTGMADLTSAMHNAVNKCSDQDESANVVQAALTLIGAVEKLLHLVETADKDNLKDLQVVVKDIGHAGRHLLCTCGELVTFDIAQKSITGISNDIVRRTAYLAKVCMSIVEEGASQDHHPRVAAAVDEMIERSNILNIVVVMLCPVLSNTLPQEVVASVVSKVAKSSESVCGLLQSTCEDDDSMSALADAGAVLIDELQGLISEVSRFTLSSMCHQMECSLSALAQSATLINGSGSSVDMIAEAKKIDKGFEAVVDLMTLQSQREEDASIAKSLLDSAKAITRGALNVIEGAKLLANSGDKQSQTVVKSAAEELLGICHSVNMLLLSKYSETRILTSAETSCDVCSQFIAVIDSVAATADGEWRSELTSQCETTRRRFFVLKCLVSRSKKNPIKLSEFTDASLALANSVGRLVSLSKSAVPRIKDQATALQLGDFAKATGSAISDLRRAAKKSAVAVQISDLDDCSEVLANMVFNGSDGATWLARDNLELSATIQALKSSKASILVALKNSDVGQLVASIKDHVDNMQTWCHAVVKSKNALQQEDGHADIDEELTRAVEYTKEFIAEAKEHVTAGGSTVEATEMLDKGWQAVSTASDILDAAGRLSEADSFPKEEKRGCFRRMTYGIVRVVKKVFSLAWLVLSYVCHLFFMAFLVVCFPFGLCYLCSKCLRRRGQDVPVLHYASSDSSSNVSDSSDDDFDASEFTVSYRGPQLNASQDVVAKLKGE
jgi:talin